VAAALPLVALTLAALIPALALRRRGALATLGSSFRAGQPLPLGALRWPAFGFAAALIALAALVPIARLAFEAGGGTRPAGWSAAAFAAAFERALELARGDLRNSVAYAFAAASACAALGLVLGHALERAPRGRAFEPLVLLPLAVPAILFGIGVIAAWNHAWSARFYDGGGLVVLLLSGRFAALSILALGAAAAMLDPALEDAARTSGARPARRLVSIVAPSLRSSWTGAWVLVFVFALRELDCTILVPAANHTAMFRVFNALHFGRDDFVAALALLTVALILLPAGLWALLGRRRAELGP
jgi:iron(III) transport system permease protein